MNSVSYGYHSCDSLLSSSTRTSTRTSVGSSENLLSVNCGPTLINSCISFGGDSAPVVYRLEMLQQIAARIQRDSLGCEDKLILAQNAVHADAKRLESGLQLQHEAEITGYLLESENLLRQQLNDAQVLLDGKYYQAEQIVQRVAKLRDDLIALRNECSSVYSTGRALTTEQTKYMMSGITQSLNSGFAQNLSPSLNSGLPQNLSSLAPSSLTTGLPHGMNARMTPALNPSFPANYGHGLIQNYMPSVDTAALQNLKLMQIRKPTMKSAIADQNMTDEEVNMNFVNDLLSWVDEMQVQLERAEWGSDLPSVESHLENHKNVHKAIEEFETSLKEAKTCELQMTGPYKPHYSEKLRKLESHYSKLLHSSRSRARHLDTLHNVVSRATRELIWLNEKEEEEVAYDWSERVPNLSRKKEYHAALMRELDHKEESMRAVQDLAEQLLVENHPARLTIEAYRAAMQTQWSWILQLCHCVEQHLRENSEYFEFFNDAKEAMDYLKHLKDAVLRKYSCDKSSSLHKLEVLLQESMEEKSQLLQYKSTVASLVGRAKAIIQLKPRNPESPLKSSIPIKAICDYRQIEITIYKNDECILAGNSHRAKWKVISPSGNEAMVPSVCFTVPPPNKEAIDTANRIEQLFQSVLTLWHESHVNMKSVVSFHFLTNEIEEIRASNVSSIKTTLPGEHQQVLSSLRSRFEDFTEDSQESKIFTVSDIGQLEREVNVCRQYYEELLRSAEREEQEESIYNLYISEVRNIRLRLETCEERLIRQIRTPLERDDLHESVFKISEQEKVKKELERLKDDLGGTTDKCEEFFNQAAASLSVPTLRSELNAVIQNMNHIYSLSSIYLEKLKTINLVLQNTQGAESLVKLYETKLCEEDAATSDKKAIEMLVATLKHWRSEVDEKREVFHALEDELQKAKAISDQMFKTHKERDLDFDWHKEKADQLAERWQNVHYQIDSRLRDLDGIGKSLKYYKESYTALDDWITQVEDTQRRLQENQPENSKALAKHLHQQKNLVSEIEMKQHKMDECQKYSEQYSASVKDYELQLMTFRAMVDSHQKSPVKRRRMQSSSDLIIQEYMELRTRYTALLTLMTQYVKFAAETQKRMEEEEMSRYKDMSAGATYPDLLEEQRATVDENRRLLESVRELETMLEEMKKQKLLLEQELPKVKAAAESERSKQQKAMEELSLQKTKAEYEARQCRIELESVVKEKAAVEQQLEHVRQLTFQSEAKRTAVEEKLRAFRTQIEESTTSRRKLEDHLKRRDTDLQDLEQQKKNLMVELRRKADIEDTLLLQLKQMEQDLEFQRKQAEKQLHEKEKIESEARRKISEARYSSVTTRETVLPTRSSVHEVHYKIESEMRQKDLETRKVEAFKQQVEELLLVNKKAEKEVKQLKSDLNSLTLQKNTAEEKTRQMKNQLEDANNKLKQLKAELEQKSKAEQDYLQQVRELDRKLHQSQDKAEEVMLETLDLKKIKMNYQDELKSLQQDKHSLDQKIRIQKTELDELRDKLKTQQEQLLQKEMAERNYQQRTTFFEEELSRKKNEIGELKKKTEELARFHSKGETNVKQLNAQIVSLREEKMVAEQKIQARKEETDSLRDQLKKYQEQIYQSSKQEKENQFKIQKLQDDLERSNQWSETLKEKLDELTKLNKDTDLLMRKVKSDSENIIMEKNNIQKNNITLKAQLDNFKEQLRIANERLQNQVKSEQEFQITMKRLEEDLAKSKNVASEYKQKCDRQNIAILNAEKEIRNFKSELSAVSMEKNLSEQKIQHHQGHLQELTSKLKKAQDDLQQKVIDEQMTQKRMAIFQEESLKHKHSAEELRKKLEKVMESSMSTESDITQMKLECVALRQEKSLVEEKLKMQKAEMGDLQERLQKCREQIQQGKQAEIEHFQRCRKLEEEVDVQKRVVDNLKQRVESQRKEHMNQLQMLQTELKHGSTLKSPGLKSDFDKSGGEFKYSSANSSRDFEQFHQMSKTSPLLRRKQESQVVDMNVPLYISEQEEDKRVRVDAVYEDTMQKDRQYQMSRMKQPLDENDSKQSFTEYVSQTSTEFQISVDDRNSLRHVLDIDHIRDKNLQNIRHTLRQEEEKLKEEVGKFQLPMEMMKSKQYDVHVEVTTLKQEKEILLNHEDKDFSFSDGFRREDLPKLSTMFSEQRSFKGGDRFQNDYPASYNKLKFQGLRQPVLAQQLVEVKLLDVKTVEQLLLGLKTIQEIQKSLDKFLTKPTAIAGLYIESKKEIISFPVAAKRKMIDKNLAFEFLEAQAATGFIIDTSTGQKYSTEEAISKGNVDQEFREKLLEAEKAVVGYVHSGKRLSVFQAIEARLLERQKGKRILEAQIATGGVIDPVRSIRIPPEVAVQQGLLNHTTFKFLLEPASNTKGFHHPHTKQSMYYSELLKVCLLDVDSQCILLPVGDRKITSLSAEKGSRISVVNGRTGAEMTRYEAYERGLIDKNMYLDLSEQECKWEETNSFDSFGNSVLLLTDLKTGRQFIVDEAVQRGLIDRTSFTKYKEGILTATELADIMVSRSSVSKDPNSPIAGFWISETNERVSVFKAIRKCLVDRVTALRCLEAQASTGGIVDPSTGKKYSVAEALERGLLDEASAKQIQQCELAFTGVIHPVSKTVIPLAEAMSMNMISKEIGNRCLEYQYLTGGLVDPKSHTRLSLEEAIKKGVLDANTASKMRDERSYIKNLTCPKTRRKLSYKDALEKAIFDCHTGLRLLESNLPPRTGISSLYLAS
ncbi:dystonin isoform X16 [Ambystoma mexicanum]|uniref:dystonin isoform X16 n=1 Tax=Ambystoma mexicanum TaxID=8296 RepID=UPI0037E99B01